MVITPVVVDAPMLTPPPLTNANAAEVQRVGGGGTEMKTEAPRPVVSAQEGEASRRSETDAPYDSAINPSADQNPQTLAAEARMNAAREQAFAGYTDADEPLPPTSNAQINQQLQGTLAASNTDNARVIDMIA